MKEKKKKLTCAHGWDVEVVVKSTLSVEVIMKCISKNLLVKK